MPYTDHIFTEYRRRVEALEASDNPFAQGIAYIEGEYVPLKQARIPILDQGFLHSDLTYDVPAVWDGRFFRLDDHLDRFERSCERLRLKSPLSRQEIRDRLVAMTAKSGIRDAYVMMIVTRGLRFVRQYAPEECENFCYLMVMPYLWVMNEETQKTGGSAVIARTVRRVPPGAIDPTVKNLQWGDLTRGLIEARDRGAMYPILTDGDANLTEGSGFNIILIKDGKLYTPRRGVLEGVTRKSVLAAAEQLGYLYTIDDVPVDLAYACDELLFVTTAGGVMPITTLDGKPVGNGEVGPISKALWKAYWDDHYDPDVSFAIDYCA
ncbi:branched-subunit amino acid aminotransferase/4-amino-4-deoxychorismate lyase [Angulomicrobium tetraedrale]|uniref:Probable branched-chain-amino-acid aminotransferase n=1 Tax=Ancylobacter tetraedralis TaxID=217068 RepID=A0A839ZDJ9_9HYPH|nr:aminotransferase class IV [Ancylobacter tetraedralis]MBB3772788.1 branched-subunit amino acid aminotransferase/4-amino-4-deoxychorismate lyase [Ancylobacter tetraedralis]